MSLYLIQTKSICEEDSASCAAFRKTCKCPGCGALRKECRNNPLDVRVAEVPDISAVNATAGSLIGIIRTDFMVLFEPEFRQHLMVGRVLDRRGAEIEGFATFLSKKPLAIRGGPESNRRFCDECGRFVYDPVGDKYVMRSSLTGQSIYEADIGDLVITEELRDRIDRKRWKGIWIQEIPVRDTPLDGIEKFPENYF